MRPVSTKCIQVACTCVADRRELHGEVTKVHMYMDIEGQAWQAFQMCLS